MPLEKASQPVGVRASLAVHGNPTLDMLVHPAKEARAGEGPVTQTVRTRRGLPRVLQHHPNLSLLTLGLSVRGGIGVGK